VLDIVGQAFSPEERLSQSVIFQLDQVKFERKSGNNIHPVSGIRTASPR
jgi:hypothetical protein